MISKIKAVIFDLDGTLADTLPLCIEAFRHSVQPLINRSVSDSEIISTFGPSEEGTIMALIPDHYEKGVADYLYHYERLHPNFPVPFDGIEELLAILKNRGVRIAMVTGKGQKSADVSLNHFKMRHFFEVIETGSPKGSRKAEAIKLLLDGWSDIEKEEVIYVGDAPSDITASRAAGVAVIAAAWAETTEAEKLIELEPDEVFYTVANFSSWLLRKID
ncbi:HAD family hydrolase [Desertivirga arenae]|uniref:HAD family hydrolase n=1 Tax=Desertivirga arenae TaxID=2810309 RepID=UPI001A95D8FD|nr:HAD family hydrolase [Pedobacter sp. SYSU D00823]